MKLYTRQNFNTLCAVLRYLAHEGRSKTFSNFLQSYLFLHQFSRYTKSNSLFSFSLSPSVLYIQHEVIKNGRFLKRLVQTNINIIWLPSLLWLGKPLAVRQDRNRMKRLLAPPVVVVFFFFQKKKINFVYLTTTHLPIFPLSSVSPWENGQCTL